MNFRTESFDLPQNEQRRCLSFDIFSLSAISYQLSAISYQLSAISHQPSETPESWTPRGGGSSGDQFGAAGGCTVGCKDRIDDPVALRLVGTHIAIPIHVLFDLLDRLAGVQRVELVHLGEIGRASCRE